MRVKRFYLERIPSPGGGFNLAPDEATHAVRVLRLVAGERIVLLDGAGVRADAEVTEVRATKRDCALTGTVTERDDFRPPRRRVHLLVAPPRGHLMGSIVRTATQLGVWRITPVLCQFGVARPNAGSGPSRWRADAVAAMKQSGNVFLPRLDAPMPFAEAIAAVPPPGYFGAVPDPANPPRLGRAESLDGDLALWIGPEGGFSESEERQLLDRGFTPCTTGCCTLTVESAVPALLGWLTGKLGNDGLLCERR